MIDRSGLFGGRLVLFLLQMTGRIGELVVQHLDVIVGIFLDFSQDATICTIPASRFLQEHGAVTGRAFTEGAAELLGCIVIVSEFLRELFQDAAGDTFTHGKVNIADDSQQKHDGDDRQYATGRNPVDAFLEQMPAVRNGQCYSCQCCQQADQYAVECEYLASPLIECSFQFTDDLVFDGVGCLFEHGSNAVRAFDFDLLHACADICQIFLAFLFETFPDLRIFDGVAASLS